MLIKRICRGGFALIVILLLITMGCGETTTGSDGMRNDSVTSTEKTTASSTEEPPIVMVKLYLDFPVESDQSFQEHTIGVCIDGNVVDTIQNDFYYTKLLEIEEGKHIIGFMLDDELVSSCNQEVVASEDMSLRGKVCLQNGEVSVDGITVSKSIADSAITYESVAGNALDLALAKLSEKHFVNVKYISNSGESIVNPEDWEVEAQNLSGGDVVDKAVAIELTCRKVYYQLYLDFTFDENLLLAKYGLTTKIDEETLGTIPHGKSFTKLLRIHEGEHTISFYKENDNSIYATKNITISGDVTLKARLHTNKKDIEINNSQLLDSVVGASIEVPNVTGMILDVALSKMSQAGFSNVHAYPTDIWVNSNWIVESQDVAAGTMADKNAFITLKCIKTLDYLTNTYLGLNIDEAEKKATEKNNGIRFIKYLSKADFANNISKMSQDDKKLWVVKQASSESGELVLALAYKGYVEMPDTIGKTLSVALAEMEKLEFSSVQYKTVDGSFVFDESNWVVTEQSVKAGLRVNADGLITLTVDRPANQSTTASSSSSSSSSSASSSSSKKSDNSTKKYTDAEVKSAIEKYVGKSASSSEYKVTMEGNCVNIFFYPEGIAGTLYKAQEENDSSAIKTWNSVVEKAKKASKTISDDVEQNMGRDDIIVCLYYCDDLGLDRVYLIVTYGVVYYDVVNDIDLMGLNQ